MFFGSFRIVQERPPSAASLEGWVYAGQYFAGYIVEKSLSIDNADPDVSGSRLVRAARRLLPVTDAYDEGRLLTRVGGQ
jgi:hypothetical protein